MMTTTMTTTMRMRWLLCLGLLVFGNASSTYTKDKNDPILIVGAGLAGLSATLELERLGYSTLLVEAAHRLGGRVSSLTNGVELGGTYLHGSNNALFDLIERYKLATVVSGGASAHPGKQSAVWMYHGEILNKTVMEERSTALYKQWLMNVQTELSNYTASKDKDETVRHLQTTSERIIYTLTSNSPLDRALVNFELNMAFEHDLGASFSHMAVQGLKDNWNWMDHDGPDRVLTDGLSTLIDAMKAEITGDILLNSHVERISYQNGNCSLTLKNDKTVLSSSACIVTIPLGVLKNHHNTLFDPPLPLAKQEALERAGVSSYNTLVLKWNKPICQAGAYYILHDDIPTDNPLASGFVCPQVLRGNATTGSMTQFYIAGNQYPFQDEAYWKRRAVKVMNQVFESQHYKEDDIVEFDISTWHENPFILGSYSAPTTLTRGNVDRAILQSSLDRTVFFAGEHTHTCGRYQSLDGAYDTGLYAARQVAALQYETHFCDDMKMTCDSHMSSTTIAR